eukprot:scaffold2187_cov101-Skeletonema_marinoi.AAC.3
MVKLPLSSWIFAVAAGGWGEIGTCEYRIDFSRSFSCWLCLPRLDCKRRIDGMHADEERRASVYFTYSTYKRVVGSRSDRKHNRTARRSLIRFRPSHKDPTKSKWPRPW